VFIGKAQEKTPVFRTDGGAYPWTSALPARPSESACTILRAVTG
jgi:hypothetical protein